MVDLVPFSHEGFLTASKTSDKQFDCIGRSRSNKIDEFRLRAEGITIFPDQGNDDYGFKGMWGQVVSRS
jgi:hypothetical protein